MDVIVRYGAAHNLVSDDSGVKVNLARAMRDPQLPDEAGAAAGNTAAIAETPREKRCLAIDWQNFRRVPRLRQAAAYSQRVDSPDPTLTLGTVAAYFRRCRATPSPS